jgi:hypothetical protein
MYDGASRRPAIYNPHWSRLVKRLKWETLIIILWYWETQLHSGVHLLLHRVAQYIYIIYKCTKTHINVYISIYIDICLYTYIWYIYIERLCVEVSAHHCAAESLSIREWWSVFPILIFSPILTSADYILLVFLKHRRTYWKDCAAVQEKKREIGFKIFRDEFAISGGKRWIGINFT